MLLLQTLPFSGICCQYSILTETVRKSYFICVNNIRLMDNLKLKLLRRYTYETLSSVHIYKYKNNNSNDFLLETSSEPLQFMTKGLCISSETAYSKLATR